MNFLGVGTCQHQCPDFSGCCKAVAMSVGVFFAIRKAASFVNEFQMAEHRLFLGMLVIFGVVGAVCFLYGLLVKSFSNPLTEKAIQQLSFSILSYYKKQIDACDLNRPITWKDLYQYMRYLEVTGQEEQNERFSKEALRKQTSCIQELVK